VSSFIQRPFQAVFQGLPKRLRGQAAHTQQQNGRCQNKQMQRQHAQPEIELALFNRVAQKGEAVLINQIKADGNQYIISVAGARVEIGKRHGQNTQNQHADGQR